MISFDFELMFKMLYKSLFGHHGTNAPLTLKRVAVLAAFLPIFFLMEITNYLGFLVDRILFPDFKETKVKEPVFIVGYPRSGTTFLHRLIGKDREHVSQMKTWELFLAPSIIQKKVLKFLGGIDRKLGSPIYTSIIAFEEKLLKKSRKFHKMGLFETEEDEIILSHIFASAFLSFIFPFEEMEGFLDFDRRLTPEKRRCAMKFYKECVQRHLYVFGNTKHFSSKNPAFSAKIQSLYETFPDAKIVCLVRTPLEAVPSAMSFMSFCMSSFNSDVGKEATDRIRENIAHWYTYPLEKLQEYPVENWVIENYQNLVKDPAETVKRLYGHFGFEVSKDYLAVLTQETEEGKKYRSKHTYCLDRFGLTEAKVVSEYEPIFRQFAFSTGTEATCKPNNNRHLIPEA